MYVLKFSVTVGTILILIRCGDQRVTRNVVDRALSRAADTVPGEYIVKVKGNAADVAASLGSFEDRAELLLANEQTAQSILLLTGLDDKTSQLRLRQLVNDPNVSFVEPNYIYHSSQEPSDPRFPELWGLHNIGQGGGLIDADIDAPEAWDVTTGLKNVVVAVIDSGVDYTHPDLKDNMWVNPNEVPANAVDDDKNGYVDDVHGINAITNSGNPMDDLGHGTHVAGTIGAVGNNSIGVVGVNWHVKILACKFLDATGGGYTSDAIKCFNYLANLIKAGLSIRLSNNSWGGGGESLALKDAMAAINPSSGEPMLHVVAAGNSNENNDQRPQYPASYDLDNIVSVAATDRNDTLASLSNYGPISVDLAAPGQDILSTVPFGTCTHCNISGYKTLSGTSMATPHITGALALVLASEPLADNYRLNNRILVSGNDISGKGDNKSKPTLTNRRLNAANALINDNVPPAPITLSVQRTSLLSASLIWTATGDDGKSGQASLYDLRFSSVPITEENWKLAKRISVPFPKPSGESETLMVKRLLPKSTYYFAIRAIDKGANISALSTVSAETKVGESLFADAADDELVKWVSSSSDPAIAFHKTNSRFVSNPRSWYYGNETTKDYSNGARNYGTLTSEPINLSGQMEVFLSFSEWSALENSLKFDRTRVQVSFDNLNWTDIFESHNTNGWQNRGVDLTAYAGKIIRLRFSFDTGDSALNNYEGWYIDDITVVGIKPVIAVTNSSIVEGNDGTKDLLFSLFLSAPSALDMTVDYQTVDGSAKGGSDYLAQSGKVVFAPGSVSQTISVPIVGDTTFERDETFGVTLSNPVNAILERDSASGSITNDDAVPSMSISDATSAEGNSGQSSLALNVSLSNASYQEITVDYQTVDGSAKGGSDYLAQSGKVVFAPGSVSQTISVPIVGDTTFERDESFVVTLSNPVNATLSDGDATGIITNDDTVPSMSISDATIVEGNSGQSSLAFNISLSNASYAEITVTYDSNDISAKGGFDYKSLTGVLVFAPGETSKFIPVSVISDTTYELGESFLVKLSNPIQATLLDNGGVGTIENDDDKPRLSILGASEKEGSEGDKRYAIFKLTLQPAAGVAIEVEYKTADDTTTAGTDFVSAANKVIFEEGETEKEIRISLIGDVQREANETFKLLLISPRHAALENDHAMATIEDDDGFTALFEGDRKVNNDGIFGCSNARQGSVSREGILNYFVSLILIWILVFSIVFRPKQAMGLLVWWVSLRKLFIIIVCLIHGSQLHGRPQKQSPVKLVQQKSEASPSLSPPEERNGRGKLVYSKPSSPKRPLSSYEGPGGYTKMNRLKPRRPKHNFYLGIMGGYNGLLSENTPEKLAGLSLGLMAGFQKQYFRSELEASLAPRSNAVEFIEGSADKRTQQHYSIMLDGHGKLPLQLGRIALTPRVGLGFAHFSLREELSGEQNLAPDLLQSKLSGAYMSVGFELRPISDIILSADYARSVYAEADTELTRGESSMRSESVDSAKFERARLGVDFEAFSQISLGVLYVIRNYALLNSVKFQQMLAHIKYNF